MAHGLEAIDWSAAWLAPWRQQGEAACAAVATGLEVAQALNALGPAPVVFVPQSSLPEGEAYESFIRRTGCCPTRNGLHDFFNGLCWHRFPLAKRRLNQLQSAQIREDGVGAVRGPVRDAITVMDENAALLYAPDPLWHALLAKDWAQLFGPLRPLWAHSGLVLFGHALLEKLVFPRKAVTAHVYRVQVPPDDGPALDAWLAADLDPQRLAAKPFAHLPVLGVPGWWAANAVPGFYADTAVFRPARRTDAQPGIQLPRK